MKTVKKLLLVFFSAFCIVGCNNVNNNEKSNLNSNNTQVKYRKFYTLESAYWNNLITLDDLLNIAYYYNNKTDLNQNFTYEITKKAPLSTSLLLEMQEAAYLQYKSDENPIVRENVNISNYYGTYSNCVALNIKADYYNGDPYYIESYTIDSVVFTNYYYTEIRIYPLYDVNI